MIDRKVTAEQLLKPYDFGKPVRVSRIYGYLTSSGADKLVWYKDLSVSRHIALVALFSVLIAEEARKFGARVDVHKTWVLGWLHDVGRVPWGIATNKRQVEITQKYGHHGYLGYVLLRKSGVPEETAIVSMTHIAGGLSKEEAQQVNQKTFGRKVFPARDWLASTLEEKIVMVADKVPGWNNTVVAPYQKYQAGEQLGGKIYSEVPNQKLPWQRFWKFKEEVDEACGKKSTDIFEKDLLNGELRAFNKLPQSGEIASMDY